MHFKLKLIKMMVTDELDSTEGNLADYTVHETKENISRIQKILESLWDFVLKMLPNFMFAAIVFIIGIVISRLFLKLFMRGIKRSRVDDTIAGFLKSFIKILLYVIVFIICLSILNVPMTSIITVLGTCGLAIGLALKDSLSNVAGGFILLFTKPFKAGDRIEYDGTMGIVKQVNILYTTFTTFDNVYVHVPNAVISGAKIINYSESDIRRVDVEISVSYESDIDKVRAVIKDIADKYDKILKDPPVKIYLSRHDESAIVFLITPWVKTDDYFDVKYYLMEEIKKRFDKEGIEIPYPHLDVKNSYESISEKKGIISKDIQNQ